MQTVCCETAVDCTNHTTDHHRCIKLHIEMTRLNSGDNADNSSWRNLLIQKSDPRGGNRKKTLLWLDLYSAGSCYLWPLWVLRHCTVYNDHEKKTIETCIIKAELLSRSHVERCQYGCCWCLHTGVHQVHDKRQSEWWWAIHNLYT